MNRILRALTALAISSWPTVAAAQYSATVLADSPVAYYRFEELAGTSALDSSGNGNSGTYTNGPLLAQPGLPQLGRAVSFDGINDHVVTPRTVANDFTLELWLRSTMIGGNTLDARYFQGLVDEVAYYPTVLLPARDPGALRGGIRSCCSAARSAVRSFARAATGSGPRARRRRGGRAVRCDAGGRAARTATAPYWVP